ncbi:MAG TPA: hypothetical protein VFH91_06535, partial [Pyrinomonadaceae bacterium]|nr:hypothetical protein [Pyrinomonadaceae bacterium]
MQNALAESTIPYTMSATERRVETTESRRTLIILVAIAAAVVIALFFYWLMRAGSGPVGGDVSLQGAIRPGSAEFDQYKDKIVLDTPEADEAKRALGDIVMSLHTTVRNFTGKTLSGLEVRAAVVDHQDKAVKERTVVVIPTRQRELGPNKTMTVSVMLEGMTDTDDRANIRMQVTG